MNVKCPVCEKEKDVNFGKFICSNCNSSFEYQSDRKIVILKRNKFDFWTFIMSLIFPILFIILFLNDTARDNFYSNNELFSGLVMIVFPLIIALRQLFFLGGQSFLFLNLYLSFFSKQLHKEDIGRIMAFYITFITNLIGLFLIITYLIK